MGVTGTKTETDWPERLEQLAREAEQEALGKADELFAKMVAEHERQYAGYVFECRRWGDYLSVFIERQSNQGDQWTGEHEKKVSTSLNIGKTKEIRIIEGHCFDRRGALQYHASMVSDDGHGSGWGTGAGRHAPGKGWHYKVAPNYPWVPLARPMVKLDPPPEESRHGMLLGNGDYQPRHVTPGYPRPAKDDEIRFEGIGTTIYAPAGKGRQVYDVILEEIERGVPPSKLPSGNAA